MRIRATWCWLVVRDHEDDGRVINSRRRVRTYLLDLLSGAERQNL